MNRKIDAGWTTEKRLRHGQSMRAAYELRHARLKEYNKNLVALARYEPIKTIEAMPQPERKPRNPRTYKTKKLIRASWTPEKRTQQAVKIRLSWRRKKRAGLYLRY